MQVLGERFVFLCRMYIGTSTPICSNRGLFGLGGNQSEVGFHIEINRSVSQIPQCLTPIFHSAPLCSRNVHTCAHFWNGALWDMGLVHFGIYENGLLHSLESYGNKENVRWYLASDISRRIFQRIRQLFSEWFTFHWFIDLFIFIN